MKRLALVLAVGLLGGFALSVLAKTAPETRHVVFITPGYNWDYGRSFTRQSGIDKHRQYWTRAAAEGKIELGGPLVKHNLALMVGAEGVGREALMALAKGDPAVEKGLLKPEVRVWTVRYKMKAPDPFAEYLDESGAETEAKEGGE